MATHTKCKCSVPYSSAKTYEDRTARSIQDIQDIHVLNKPSPFFPRRALPSANPHPQYLLYQVHNIYIHIYQECITASLSVLGRARFIQKEGVPGRSTRGVRRNVRFSGRQTAISACLLACVVDEMSSERMLIVHSCRLHVDGSAANELSCVRKG